MRDSAGSVGVCGGVDGGSVIGGGAIGISTVVRGEGVKCVGHGSQNDVVEALASPPRYYESHAGIEEGSEGRAFDDAAQTEEAPGLPGRQQCRGMGLVETQARHKAARTTYKKTRLAHVRDDNAAGRVGASKAPRDAYEGLA